MPQALFKLKSDADPKSVRQWQDLAHAMVGKVPGLLELQAGPPVELTAPMAKGYDMGVVVLVDYVETLATFFTHPSHDEYCSHRTYFLVLVHLPSIIRVHELYMQVCEQGSTIGYDIEF
ncbi:hypothetical protein AOCH_000147 [Aspergillus ochraceoroseus]|uniref:Stress-response A/B barrel domain-containing protein n=1 Tax=Aspergillus ochraceoroseus TaxID=138278 RepID=A0A0F8US14_9EURO|nr:hypothetical protein AOCH_000147 [Aspergillus ochraceoroseus]